MVERLGGGKEKGMEELFFGPERRREGEFLVNFLDFLG